MAAYRPPRELTEAEIVGRFHEMRGEQRKLISKLSELESDRNEHKLVVQTLKDVPPERRCFRMMGGVLMERTVKEVLPTLEDNLKQLIKITDKLKVQVEEKGREVNAFKEKYNIRFKGEMESERKKQNAQQSKTNKEQAGQGILIS